MLALVGEGLVDGLRVDHPDGLADPAGYLRQLRDRGAAHVWVEKILEADETLRDWPVEGTVGYEFCNDVAALWVDPAGEEALTELWSSLDPTPWDEHVTRAKREQASTTFTREVARLGEPATAETVAALPIYRTYVEPWSGKVEAADRAAIDAAGLPDVLAGRLLLEEPGHEAFVTRFQQTTPPVMAKGVEDTAFYRYLRLVALNEVGGDPGRFGLSLEAFHERQAERARRFPNGLLVTQTHDTKRSGDARARIGALAGMAEEWTAAVADWRRLNAPLHDGEAPDGVEEYLIYQTLVGVWPITPERLEEYLVKALREGKRNTSWVEQDHAWEDRVTTFATSLLRYPPFRQSFEPFVARVAAAGREALLGQLLLKLTSPGLPDVYQGDELLSLSLVDPDNRRPVDWERRRALLDEVRAGADPTPETEKLWLIHTALALRARSPEPFAGGYAALDAGPDAVAYTRGSGAILVMARLRGEAALVPPGRGGWRDVLGGKLGDGLVLAERA